MLQEQHLKDLQHRWRAEMLQGHKTWENETAGRVLQPSHLPFITGGPDKGLGGGSQWCFKSTQAALKYSLPRVAHGDKHLKEQAVASRCQHEKVLGLPKAPLIQGLLWHAGIFLNVLQL